MAEPALSQQLAAGPTGPSTMAADPRNLPPMSDTSQLQLPEPDLPGHHDSSDSEGEEPQKMAEEAPSLLDDSQKLLVDPQALQEVPQECPDEYLEYVRQYLLHDGTGPKYPPHYAKNSNLKRALRRKATANYRLVEGQLQYRTYPTKKVQAASDSESTGANQTLLPGDDDVSFNWRVVVLDRAERREIMEKSHAGHFGGEHLGRDKTHVRICRFYYWPLMTFDIREFVLNCEKCRLKKSKRLGAANKRRPITNESKNASNTAEKGTVWGKIGVDLLGPLSETERGNCYICVITCVCTRWADAHPMTSKSPESVARALAETFFRFGFPRTMVISEHDKNFSQSVIQALHNKMDRARLNATSAELPQCQERAERFNASLETMLMKEVKESPESWSLSLPSCLYAYNTTIQRPAKSTQFFRMYRRHPGVFLEPHRSPVTEITHTPTPPVSAMDSGGGGGGGGVSSMSCDRPPPISYNNNQQQQFDNIPQYFCYGNFVPQWGVGNGSVGQGLNQ